MKKVNLKELDFGASNINMLQREQMKTVCGGAIDYDGFKCAADFERCDSQHPEDFNEFQECMFWAGCLY